MTAIEQWADSAYVELWPVEKVEQMAEALEAIAGMHTGVPGFSTVAYPEPAVRCKQCGTLSPCDTLRAIHDALGINGEDGTK